VFFEDLDYTDWKSVSADWAGGGLVSTTEGLSRFLRAFADDGIFADPKSKTEMLSWGPVGSTGVYYGLGVTRVNLDEHGMAGVGDFWGHDGFPQSFLFYWPKQQVTIVGTLNQAVSERVFWAQLVVSVIVALD
jgi:D-alanyl-D-alanine carboxypeptidase